MSVKLKFLSFVLFRLSSHPQGVGTPERIPLQNMSQHLCQSSHSHPHQNNHPGMLRCFWLLKTIKSQRCFTI